MDNMEFDYKEIAGYKFKNPTLLKEALTHSSYGWTNEDDELRIDNEKLEFLGDAYLDAIVGSRIFEKLPRATREGELTKVRAQVVCEKSLAALGRKMNLGSVIRLGPGEEKTGGRDKDSILADAVESVIGAIYIDGGYHETERMVLAAFDEMIDEAISGNLVEDHKTVVHERAQQEGATLKYILDRTEGPDHDKTFFVHIEINGVPMTKGVGKSKKEAQQDAAGKLIEKGLDNVF